MKASLAFALASMACTAAACGLSETPSAVVPIDVVPDGAADAIAVLPSEDAGKDSRTVLDANVLEPLNNGWTAETQKDEIYRLGLVTPNGLVADPATPRRLMVRLASSTLLAVRWEDGKFGRLLKNSTAVTAVSPAGSGGGFAGGGTFYDYLLVEPSQAFVAVEEGGRWIWKVVLGGGLGNWPPSGIRVTPGTGSRAFTSTSSVYIELSTLSPLPLFPSEGLGTIALKGDGATFLSMSINGLRRCSFRPHVCSAVPTNLPSDVSVRSIAYDPFNTTHVLLTKADGSVIHSTDDGVTFSDVPLPINSSRTLMAVPGKPNSFVTYTVATPGTEATVQTTDNAGTTWTALKFPNAPTEDIGGLVIDPDGTLFLLRSGRIYSKKL